MMKKFLLKFWSPLFLFFLVAIVFLTNFSPNTFLSGWDNLHPEFYPLMNLERAWQSAWQEYQGLGLLAGMAHSADLFRQLIFLPITLLLPTHLFRYFWHFLMILIGVFSSFYLFKFLLKKHQQHNLLAFLGASFYLLNFGTVQNFYVTFEPFAAFYAFIPLLIFLLLKLLYEKVLFKKNLLIFFLVSLFSSSMFYVQTIFIVYLAIISLLFLIYFLQNKSELKRVLTLLFLVLLINSFWLFNVVHFTLSGSSLLADSKGKAMSNEILSLKNQAYGDLPHLIKIQGFWLDQNDFDQFGNSIYLFDAWKTHFSKPVANILAYVFFALLVLGVWQFFRQKHQQRYFILLAFLLSMWMMALWNFPFVYLSNFLEKTIPFFAEMFRINFTKWIVPYSLFYSLLLSFGLAFIFSKLKNKIAQYILASIFFISLIFYSLPIFTGNFFYSRLRVNIPNAYFQLFAYFKNEIPQSRRIANLPQHSFYSWQWNDWGYRGSGFIWYGIKQPILDRAFDVWSEANERYYWQLQAALDKKDLKDLENVLAQYDVNYLLLDESIINRNTKKPINYQAIKEFLLSSEQIELIAEFDFLSVYSFLDQDRANKKDFINLYEKLPLIDNEYNFSWSDPAFADYAHYLTVDQQDAEVIYAFPSLFTNHLQKDLEFSLSEDESYFYITSMGDNSLFNYQLFYEDLLKTESKLAFRLSWLIENDQVQLNFRLLAPEIIEKQQVINFSLVKDFNFDVRSCLASEACYINVNNQLISPLSESGEIDLLLDTRITNTIALSTEQTNQYYNYAFFDLSLFSLESYKTELASDKELTIKIPRVLLQSNIINTELNTTESKNCRAIQEAYVAKDLAEEGNYYQAIGTSICDDFYLANLNHDTGHLIKINAQNFFSMPALFAVQVESLGRSPLETYLSEGINYQILPPTEYFNQGYTLYFSTDSYGSELNKNLLKSAEVFYWPYAFLSQLTWRKDELLLKNQEASCDFTVSKKALWFYQVDLSSNCQANYLSFTQAYDRAWLAYQNGQKLKHYQFNNWANAWELNDQNHQRIYIFYWPQLLELFGLINIGLVAAIMIFNYQRKSFPRLREKSSQ